MLHKNHKKISKILLALALVAGLLCTMAPSAHAIEGRELASVTTEWKAVGANHKIMVVAFQDPDIPEITCYVSQAKTGGISGSVGLAEDPSNFALSCVRSGIPTIKKKLPKDVELFTKSTSLFFKATRVHRIYDAEQQAVVYLAVSRRLLEGSPFSAISAVSLK